MISETYRWGDDARVWRSIAASIERGNLIFADGESRWGTERWQFGLCAQLEHLRQRQVIDTVQYHRLERQLAATYGSHAFSPTYYWALDANGDRARASACRAMAAMSEVTR